MDEQDDGVSVVVRRRVHPARLDDFERWLPGIISAAKQFEGHQGAQLLRPPDPANQDFVLLFRYRTAAQLAAWQESDIARDWLKRGEDFTVGDVHIEKVTGLEFWFDAPGRPGAGRPSRPKMMIATVVGLYPLILLVAPQLTDLFGALPQPLAVLASTVCMVALMTYVVMPIVTRTLSRWL